MRILLIGEYSGYHNALKHGIQSLGHEVVIAGDGDGFKKFPVDIDLGSDYFRRNWFREKIKVAWWKLTGNNLEDYLRLARFRESEKKLANFDIIQFINSNALGCAPNIEWQMMQRLLENNSKVFLIACGDDCEYSNYLVNQHKGYSILKAAENAPTGKAILDHTYKYLDKGYRDNYNKLMKRCVNIVPSNTDYAMALTNQNKATSIIAAPVVVENIPDEINHDLSVIEIFMGINRGNYWKKGINYFEKALEIVKEKYKSKVNITIAEDLPYTDYITSYKKAHILLDQVLCFDQGYNALQAMLRGKVVFAGAGEPYFKFHNIDKIPVIDATPDVMDIVDKLSELIENPTTIIELGKAARKHVIHYHDAVKIARQFEHLYK